MALAVRITAWWVAKARMIQLTVKGTVHRMRVVRRPHRSISKPLRNAPNGLAIDCTLAAITHANLERYFLSL
jgi:hypothetical protein